MAYEIPFQNATEDLTFLMIDAADHISSKTGLTPTVTIRKNGASSFITPVGAVSELGSGWYRVAPNASDADAVGPLLLHATGLGADPTDVQFDVLPGGVSAPSSSSGSTPGTYRGVGGLTFLELYGTKLDRELGSSDRTQRFTTALRKEYVNEGHRKFNEQTSCFVRRAPIALTAGVSEYDLEAPSVIGSVDYLWPSKTTASLKRVGTSTSYSEGPHLPFKSEEELNQTRWNWRAESAGTPECWTLREDGGAQYVVLVPAPDVPAAETWTLLWPYIAVPPALIDDDDVPYSIDGDPRTTLYPYHDALLYYAAAQCEKLRKNYEGVERQLKFFAAVVSKYYTDQQPKRGSQIRLAQDYRRRLRSARPVDPTRWP